MKYSKKPLTIEEQADLLLSRGLIARKDELIRLLKSVNYYRFSGYALPFKISYSDNFLANTYLADIVDVYEFDRELRFLLFEGVKRLEIYFRTKIAYHFSHKFDPFAYKDLANLPRFKKRQHELFLKKIREEVRHSKEQFVKHFKKKYDDDYPYLPIWMVVELLSFGSVSKLFASFDEDLAGVLARPFAVHSKVLIAWLKSICYVRNLCAHHARVWNRVLGVMPKLPKKEDYWKGVSNKQIFAIILIMNFLFSRIDDQADWAIKLKGLLAKYAKIPLGKMGFPDNWGDFFDA